MKPRIVDGIDFDESEVTKIFQLRDQYNHSKRLGIVPDTEFAGVPMLLRKLAKLSIVRDNTVATVRMNSGILELANKLEQSPDPDYCDSASRWFRAKWWSVPLMVILTIASLNIDWQWAYLLFIEYWIGNPAKQGVN